jgi:UDP-N-acetylmuramate--alanine ligase
MSLITGIDWDHPDIFPTRENYNQAFTQFFGQSEQVILWEADAQRLGVQAGGTITVMPDNEPGLASLVLPGLVNRQDAWEVAVAVHRITGRPMDELIGHLNNFPGVGRRFERLAPNIYSDYAHTPPKIRGALQLAHEVAGNDVVVVYEGLHNTRQHFIKDELAGLFAGVKQLYIVPSYLAREDPNLKLLSPADLKALMHPEIQALTIPAGLDDELAAHIKKHAADGDLVLCISAGGGGSLDEWLRKELDKRGQEERGNQHEH